MQMQRVVAAIPRTACEQLRHAPNHTFASNLPPDHHIFSNQPRAHPRVLGDSSAGHCEHAGHGAKHETRSPVADPAAVDALTIAHKMLVSAALTNPVIPQQAGQLLPAQQPLTAAYDPTIGRNFDSGPARYEPDNRLWACGYFGRAPTHGVRSTGTGLLRAAARRSVPERELRQWVRPESGEGAEPAAATAITGKRGLPAARAAGCVCARRSTEQRSSYPSPMRRSLRLPHPHHRSLRPPHHSPCRPLTLSAPRRRRPPRRRRARASSARWRGASRSGRNCHCIRRDRCVGRRCPTQHPRAVPPRGSAAAGERAASRTSRRAAANARSGKGFASPRARSARPPARPRPPRRTEATAACATTTVACDGDRRLVREPSRSRAGDSHGAAAQYSECLPREPNEACEPRPPPGFVMQLRTCSHRLSRCTDSLGPALVVARPPGGGDGREDLPVLVVFVGRVDVLVAGPVAEGEARVPSGRNDGRGLRRARSRADGGHRLAAHDRRGVELVRSGPACRQVRRALGQAHGARGRRAARAGSRHLRRDRRGRMRSMCYATPRRAFRFGHRSCWKARCCDARSRPAAAAPAVPSSRVETCKLTLRVQDGWCGPTRQHAPIESRGLSTHLMHPADEESAAPTTPDTRTLRAAILTAQRLQEE